MWNFALLLALSFALSPRGFADAGCVRLFQGGDSVAQVFRPFYPEPALHILNSFAALEKLPTLTLAALPQSLPESVLQAGVPWKTSWLNASAGTFALRHPNGNVLYYQIANRLTAESEHKIIAQLISPVQARESLQGPFFDSKRTYSVLLDHVHSSVTLQKVIWRARWVDRELSLLSLTGPLGSRRFFRVIAQAPPTVSRPESELTLKLLTREEIPFGSPAFFPERFVPPSRPALSKDALLDLLVKHQSLAITQGSPPRNGLNETLRQANRRMVQVLDSARDMDVKLLKKIHSELRFPEIEEQESEMALGVLRGTRESFVRGKILIDADLRFANHIAIGAGIRVLPAAQVPARIQALLARVNEVRSGHSFKDIVSIYRDFIFLQPFVNGNHRMAAVLLDFCLLRAGYLPLPHTGMITRDVYYKTTDQLIEAMQEAYEAVNRNRPNFRH